MQVKTYRGKTLEECFSQVKSEMGREAVILQSRTYQPIFGKFGPAKHEVIAALEINIGDSPLAPAPAPAPSKPAPRSVYGYSPGGSVEAPPKRPTWKSAPPAQAAAPAIEPPSAREPELAPAPETASHKIENLMVDRRIDRLEQQINSLTANMTKLTEAALARKKKAETPAMPSVPPRTIDFGAETEILTPHASLMKRLGESEVAAPVIRQLMEDLAPDLSDQAAAAEIRTRISQRLKIAPQIEPIAGKTQAIAFLGATGVGKTTTLTKLAARLSLLSSYSVGVITIDTHRIAAAKQLETYGEILRVPVQVCYSRNEVLEAVERYAAEKKSFVLIDTAGKSPNDALPLAEVSSMLSEIASLTRVLCVPATLSAANVDHMVTRFQSLLSPDAMILTKVDETVDDAFLGHLLNTQAKFGTPLSYFTNGQRVPDDMARPDSHMIAEKILPIAAM